MMRRTLGWAAALVVGLLGFVPIHVRASETPDTTTASPDVDNTDTTVADGWYADQRGGTMQFWAVGSAQSWANIPVRTAGFHFVGGGKTSAGAFAGRFIFERGHTQGGLVGGTIGTGFDWMAPIGSRFHAGAGVQFGLHTYRRATTGKTTGMGVVGVRFNGQVDIVQSDLLDMVFQLRGGPDGGMGPGYWDVMAGLGLVFCVGEE